MIRQGVIIIMEILIIIMFVAIAALAFVGCGAGEVKAQKELTESEKIDKEYRDACKLINLRYTERRATIYLVYDGPLFKNVGNLKKGDKSNLMNKRTIELRKLGEQRDKDLRSAWYKYKRKRYKEIGLHID